MLTWGEIAHASGMELSVTSAGGSFDATEESYILRRLRALLDSWILKGWVFPARGYEIIEFSPNASGQIFTLGPNKDIASTRVPLRLQSVMFQSKPLIQTDFLSLLKESASAQVTHFFYELVSDDSSTLNFGKSQFGKLHFNREAAATHDFKVIFQNTLLSSSDLVASEAADLMPGYERLVIFHLALELANTYEKDTNNYNRIQSKADELLFDVMELNKDLYAAIMGTMVKTPVPGTDAKVKGNSPVVGMPINRDPQGGRRR